jgi:hypothetical protein
MEDVILPLLIGLLLIGLGIANFNGHINSLHRYHRHRVTEEDRLPFGRLVGTGTVIIGVGICLMSLCQFAVLSSGNTLWLTVGSALLIVGLVIGLGLNFYAMIKYNKGIF